MKKFKCPKCDKEYSQEYHYLKHLEKCNKVEEVVEIFETITEEELFEETIEIGSEVLTNDEEIFKNPDLYANKDTKKLKKLKKAQKIVEFFDKMKVINGLPQDKHTRSIVFQLYNEYYNITQKDCPGCIFEDIYTQLQRVYKYYST